MDYEPPPAFSQPQERMGPLPPSGGLPPQWPPQWPGHWPGQAPPRGPQRPLSATATVVAVAAVVVAALTVVGIVLLFRASGTGPQRRVSLPGAAGGYRLIRAVDGKTAVAVLGPAAGSLGPISPALTSAKIGLYGTGGADALPTVVFLGFNRADSAEVDNLIGSGSSSQVAREILAGAGSVPPGSFATGPFGGSLQCAQAASNGMGYTACVWVDGSTLALVLRTGDIGPGDTATLTRRFRAAAEH